MNKFLWELGNATRLGVQEALSLKRGTSMTILAPASIVAAVSFEGAAAPPIFRRPLA